MLRSLSRTPYLLHQKKRRKKKFHLDMFSPSAELSEGMPRSFSSGARQKFENSTLLNPALRQLPDAGTPTCIRTSGDAVHLPESRDAKRTSILLSLLLRPTSRWKYCDFTARDSKKPTRNAASMPNCVNAARVNCKIPAEPSTDQLTKCCVSLEAQERATQVFCGLRCKQGRSCLAEPKLGGFAPRYAVNLARAPAALRICANC